MKELAVKLSFPIGAESEYRIPEGAERNLLDPQVREQLKTLFGQVFVNDQTVLSAVREAMTQC